MKVAIIKPPEVHPYWYKKRPALGISYLSSYLTKNKIANKIFDAYYFSWSSEETVKVVAKYKPDLIGISSMTHEIIATHQLTSLLKEKMPEVPIIIGGCHITALPVQTLKEFPNFTYGVYGEGEKTLLELVSYLKNNKRGRISSIKGLVYRNKQGKIFLNKTRERLTSEELDALPFPAFHFYYKKGRKSLAEKDDHYVMMTSRGCPYNCVFCMQVLGRQVRRRTPEGIVAEIEYAINHYGAHTIQFYDEIFLFNDEICYQTLDLIIQRNLHKKIQWFGLTRVNMVNKELIHKAKEAGCFRLEMGIESGSNKILRRINKQITVKQVEQAVNIIKDEKILTDVNYILGHPGETRKTLQKTVNLAIRLNTTTMAMGIMVPYPGTEVYKMVQEGRGGYRLLSKDWSAYDKYGGKALEIKGLPLAELERWQRKALLYFYLKNFRFWELLKFVIEYRRVIISLLLPKH